ncbi:oligosaccharide repeat unit polymerase family protein [Gordonia amicalis]|uniref:oligosaccharide repeat unit polymerase n=1 Tax=Gordonia amicalis TaxID=89053 RepID=UPI001EE0B050|nr:oligosaccharide repeat unit polymerase [Gordonia amicalis]UKO94022.1 oligosaccharide repeat unit polymerase family protein [Gordonia amicalis]
MTGYYLGAGIITVRTTGRLPRMKARRLESCHLRPGVLYLTYGLGVVAMLAYWVRAGGIPVFAADLENARLTALTGSGVPFYMSFLMMVGYWLMLAPRSPVSSGTRWILFILTVLLLASTGWRNTVFAFVVLTLLIQHYIKPIRTPVIFGAGAAAVLGAVAVGLYRVQSSNLTNYATYQLVASSDYLGATRVYLSTYFDAFARNLATVFDIVPYSMPYQHGKSFIWNFLALVPGSSLEPFDFKLKQAAGQGFAGGGLPPTLVGEFYVNFGTAGIFVGMMVIGLLAAIFHAVARGTTSYILLIVGLIGSYYIFVSVRGGIGNVTLTVTWLILSTLLVSRFAMRSAMHTTSPEPKQSGKNLHSPVASC